MRASPRGLSGAILCLTAGFALDAQAAAPVFTGHADQDFKASDPQTVYVSDSVGDVGVPSACATGTVSGFDMNAVWLYYDRTSDTVYVGLQSYGIAGDADGDGDPSRTSSCLSSSGGVDAANFGDLESFSIYFDTSGDGNPDVIVGKPAQVGTSIANFTTAVYSGSIYTPAYSFGSNISANVGTYYKSPSSSAPHLEFTIPNFTRLPGFKSGINPKTDAISFAFGAFQGSYEAAAFGQDYVPGTGLTQLANFPAPVVGTVTGSVFQDLNGNGAKDSGEGALANVPVKLVGDVDGDGKADTLSANSASDGSFSFTPLGAATYTVTITAPFGYTATTATSQNATITKTQTITLTAFGLKQADSDLDGIPDLTEGTGDPDGDGKPNYLDLDSDGDSIPDNVEAGPNPASPVDTDGDGKPNYLDPDSDGDKIPDSVELTGDPDGDGKPSYLDPDSDGDTIPDSVELTGDPDGDGKPNYLDPDSDDDGLGDTLEAGSNPAAPEDFDGDGKPNYLDQDSDDDGMPDADEGCTDTNGDGLDDQCIDTDKDGLPNPHDLDSDGDGVQDGTETGVTAGTALPDTDIDSPSFIPDADPTTTTNPLDKDTDDDGIADGVEDKNHTGAQDAGETRPDRADSDNDGIQDGTELGYTSGTSDTDPKVFVPDAAPSNTTNPLDPDTDHGGMPDGQEDPNHNGRRDALERDPLNPADDPDAELDGIPDTVEGTGDTDNDGTPDYWDTDSDNDSIPDTVEAGSNPKQPVDTDGDGKKDYLDTDSDGDKIPDTQEAGSDPSHPRDTEDDGRPDYVDTDSDDDGLPDSDEASGDHDGDGLENYRDPDADNDGLFDGTEKGITTPSLDTDLETGNFVPDTDPATTTDPFDADTDDDGLLDGNEDVNHDGTRDSSETDPNKRDTDGDCIQDGTELGLDAPQLPGDGTNIHDTDLKVFVADEDPASTTDPLDTDTDNGGISDGIEDHNCNGGVEPKETDPVNPADDNNVDGDQDGIPDVTELEIGTNPKDVDSDDDGVPDGEDGTQDTDGDSKIDALDPDSDNDGIKDGTELGVTSPTANTDLDAGNYVADGDPTTTTDPKDQDTDDDGLEDGSEDPNLNGRADSGETDASNPDTDHDGIQDGTESGLTAADVGPDTSKGTFVPDADPTTTTDPLDDDNDDDGLTDGNEDQNHNGRRDETETDPLKVDTDGDCLQDGTELGLTTPQGTGTNAQVFTPDSDPSTTTDPLEADTDGGGRPDGDVNGEDANCNGSVDSSETNPTDPSDDIAGEPSPTPGETTPPDGAQEIQGGGGCRGCDSSSGGRPGFAGMALFGAACLTIRRRRAKGAGAGTGSRLERSGRWLLPGVCLMLVGGAGTARAQQDASAAPQIDVQQFHPSEDVSGAFMTTGSKTLEAGGFNLGLWANYSHNPLVVLQDGTVLYALQSGVLGVDLVGGIGLFNGLQLNVDLPATAYQSVSTDSPFAHSPSSNALSDISLGLKWRWIDGQRHPIGLAFEPRLFVPSGSPESYTGGQFGLAGTFILDVHLQKGAWLGANLGYRYRSTPQTLANLVVDDELIYRLGLGIPAGSSLITADLFGRVGVQRLSDKDVADLPLELMVGLAHPISPKVTLNLGVSTGLVAGYGTPDFRVVGGLTWGVRSNDRDADGITDTLDRCPNEPEDKDGFQDTDGCPDPDNDSDGILDTMDRCPNDPEDKDGFQDADGCPDPDNDGDGVLDTMDRCPNDPEDKDGFQDADGCPDPDNDGDGLLDAVDHCPNEPEDRDGFQDVDGCPDPDNDNDGIADAMDKCPTDPEDRDGFQDADGCPDPDNDGDGVIDAKDKCPNDPETLNGFEDEDGCPDIKPTKNVTSEGGKLVLLEKIYFALDKADIKPQSFKILDEAVSVFKQNPTLRIRIEGHTDDQGSDEHNLDLSQRRSDSVKAYLVKHGIDASRIDTKGYGESKPIVPNDSEENRAKNRRIEWVILTGSGPSSDVK